MRNSLLFTLVSASSIIGLFGAPAKAQQGYASNSGPLTTTSSASAPARVSRAVPAVINFTGRVVTSNGPLPGAVVKLMGSNQLTVSDADGQFSFTVPAGVKALQLTASYAGYDNETVSLSPTDKETTVMMTKVVRTLQARSYLKSAQQQAKSGTISF